MELFGFTNYFIQSFSYCFLNTKNSISSASHTCLIMKLKFLKEVLWVRTWSVGSCCLNTMKRRLRYSENNQNSFLRKIMCQKRWINEFSIVYYKLGISFSVEMFIWAGDKWMSFARCPGITCKPTWIKGLGIFLSESWDIQKDIHIMNAHRPAWTWH